MPLWREHPDARGMIRVLILCLAVGACASPFVQRPPARYRGDATVTVHLGPTRDIPAICHGALNVVGCYAAQGVYLPNPCEWPDPFAQLFCHELAHQNGWPANHPK